MCLSSCFSCTLSLKVFLRIREASLFQYVSFARISMTEQNYKELVDIFVPYESFFEVVKKKKDQVFYFIGFS